MSLAEPRRLAPQDAVARLGHPAPAIVAKILDRVDEHARAFIARSPFVVVASTDGDGGTDASPRGDRPGFVEVLHERRLVIPERPGNRLAQTIQNVSRHPGVGLLFLVPGVEESLRVNGRAYLTDEPALLEQMRVGETHPPLATVVDVDECYVHCGRAILRSRLWEAAASPDATAASEQPDVAEALAAAIEANTDGRIAPTPEQVRTDLDGAYRHLY